MSDRFEATVDHEAEALQRELAAWGLAVRVSPAPEGPNGPCATVTGASGAVAAVLVNLLGLTPEDANDKIRAIAG
jgi:hypothetical protein